MALTSRESTGMDGYAHCLEQSGERERKYPFLLCFFGRCGNNFADDLNFTITLQIVILMFRSSNGALCGGLASCV